MDISGFELRRALRRMGFHEVRTRGSHCIMKDSEGRVAIVPLHHHSIGKGLLERIVKDELKMGMEEFWKQFKR